MLKKIVPLYDLLENIRSRDILFTFMIYLQVGFRTIWTNMKASNCSQSCYRKHEWRLQQLNKNVDPHQTKTNQIKPHQSCDNCGKITPPKMDWTPAPVSECEDIHRTLKKPQVGRSRHLVGEAPRRQLMAATLQDQEDPPSVPGEPLVWACN